MMEWALGTRFNDGKISFHGVDAHGFECCVNAADLPSVGIGGRCGSMRKSGLVTNLGDWKRLENLDPIMTAVGAPVHSRANSHAVFQFTSGKLKLIVPALVLLRGLFIPERHFLPALFEFQALDRSCFLDVSMNPPTAILHACWAQVRNHALSRPVANLAQWLLTHQSARSTANSIFYYGLQGAIDLDLPNAILGVNAFGKRYNDFFFVQKISVSTIEPTEKPIVGIAEEPQKFLLAHREPTFKTELQVPVASDGRIHVSDDEWKVLEPILVGRMLQKKIVHNQRAFFDAILEKILKGTPWKKVSGPDWQWFHVQRVYRKWSESGALQEAFKHLHQIRAA